MDRKLAGIKYIKPAKKQITLDVASEQATTYLYRGYRILGLRIPQNYKIPYIIYSFILNAIITIFLPCSFTTRYVGLDLRELDMGSLLTSLQVGINGYGCSSKIIIMAFMLPRLSNAHKLLKQMDSRCRDEDEIDELHKVVQFGRKCFIFFVICYYSYSTVTLIASILVGHPPLSLYLPFIDWQRSKLELFIVILIEYSFINFSGLQQLCDDTYPVIYVGILRGHVKILLKRVQKLCFLGHLNEEESLKELKLVIKDHKNLIELYNIIAPVISLTTFVQFLFTAFVLASSLINVTIYTTELSGRIGCLLFMFAAVLQIFPLCYFATGLTEDSSKLSNEIFHSSWFDQHQRYRRTLIFFIQRSQQNMQLKAQNFFPINLNSFVSLAKFSFSLYTLIKNMGVKE